MGHEIDLYITGYKIAPIPEGADRNRPTHCGAHAGPTPPLARATIRTSDSSLSIIAALTVSHLSRRSTETSSRPCRSRAGGRTGVNGFRRFEQRRSDASQHHQRLADIATITDRMPPFARRLRLAATNHADRVLAMITGDRNKLVLNLLLAYPRARSIPLDNCPPNSDRVAMLIRLQIRRPRSRMTELPPYPSGPQSVTF